MPVYNYECQNCEYFFEEYQKINDDPLKKCPSCKKTKLIKVISLPARPVVPGDMFEEMAKIKREAKQTAKKIMRGDEAAAADVFGENKTNSNIKLPTPKKLSDVKGGKIKRRK